MSEPTLVLFTLEFPYGKGEAFLENEIGILANQFSKVYVIPSSYPDGQQRLKSLPENVVVLQLFRYANGNVPVLKIILLNLSDALNVYFNELKSKDRYKYLKYYKSFLHYLAQDLHRKKNIKKFIKKHNLTESIFYDYWFVNSTISLALLKREGKINKLVCRAHRFDLYDEMQFEEVVSFRNFKLNYLDKVFLISKHGYQYLMERTPENFKHKLELSYLGVVVPENDVVQYKKPNNNQLLFVSCSRLLDFKRTHIIPQVLNQIESPIPIKWVHFGDGPFKNKLNEAVTKLNKSVDFDFKGNVHNREVHNFYQSNYVDFFISLSISEGLPVSMMEAIAYGVPVIATVVNGVSEIANLYTGIPLMPDEDVENMALRITEGLKKKFHRDGIRKHFNLNFNAAKNYQHFTTKLLEL